ncbi:hypothetical protein L873DRAFT_1803260 [Choiromyces venosus 120613-1]|uniref:Uncharacterized protein n=1 Tax=Choiromyces venosus 120613-1 TaxID=1336337 RepID=A0A3N4JWG4_9PEZI|nr:hypothetical protein L873DRAFT_1803260 [Choiromyces venosus 120613-1]
MITPIHYRIAPINSTIVRTRIPKRHHRREIPQSRRKKRKKKNHVLAVELRCTHRYVPDTGGWAHYSSLECLPY